MAFRLSASTAQPEIGTGQRPTLVRLTSLKHRRRLPPSTPLSSGSNLDRRRTRPLRRRWHHRASKENHNMSDETEVVEVVELAPEELAEVAGGAVPDPFILGGK